MSVSYKKYFALALDLAAEMLKNGGETYRAEESARNILTAGGADRVEIMAFPTAVSVTAEFKLSGEPAADTVTEVRSLKTRTTDLLNIDSLNTISREVTSGKMSVLEARDALERVQNRRYRPYVSGLFACISSASFTLMLGGTPAESVLAFFVALCTQFFVSALKNAGYLTFFTSLGASILGASLARILTGVFPGTAPDFIIIGSIMPLLPGLAAVNAIRDTLYGDLISGTGRGTEAMLSAVAIAAGVGIVLAL